MEKLVAKYKWKKQLAASVLLLLSFLLGPLVNGLSRLGLRQTFAPLVAADDAHHIDTSRLSAEEVVERMLAVVTAKL